MNAVKISCEGASKLPLDTVLSFQDDLKVLSEESYQKLKGLIVDLGFSFPLNIWRHQKKNKIIDAHQRVATLKRMREEGFKVPDLPVCWIHAKDETEAAKKVLAAVSQFGDVTMDGLNGFLKRYRIKADYVVDQMTLPNFDIKAFQQAYHPDTKSVAFNAKGGARELTAGEFSKFDHTCPKCGFGFDEVAE